MPLFEYICTDCGETFEELVFSARRATEIVCPGCTSEQVKKKISTFASRIAGSSTFSSSASAAAACNTGSV